MDVNRQLSREVYKIEHDKLKVDNIVEQTHELVLDTMDTYKDILHGEMMPRNNGMQAMVTATIKGEFQMLDLKDLKKISGYPESVITNHLTITYTGTNINSEEDRDADYDEIFRNDKKDRGVFSSALTYANEVEKKYPKEKGYQISVTGHSLGASEATYVAHFKGYDAFVYSAASPGLTDEQIQNTKGLIVNIYDTSDIVTSGALAGGQDKFPFYSFGIDNAGWKTGGHSLDQFHTDDLGNYIDKHGKIIVYSNGNGGIDLKHSLMAQKVMKNNDVIKEILLHPEVFLNKRDEIEQLEKLKQLKQENQWFESYLKEYNVLNQLQMTFAASGGSLSSSERIYLDDSEALMAVELATSQFNDAVSGARVTYQKGIAQIEEQWYEGLRTVEQMAPDLSHQEIVDIMALEGCTAQRMLHEPIETFQNKINQLNQIEEDFMRLTYEIKQKIHELVQRDQDLASQIRGAL